MLSMDKDYIFHLVHKLYGLIEKEVMKTIVFTLISSLTVLAIVILLVLAVSFFVTLPLLWICQITKPIVESFGTGLYGIIDFGGTNMDFVYIFWFKPHTELNDIVEKLHKMINKFSGVGAHSKAMEIVLPERLSRFYFLGEFEEIYFRRRDPGFRFGFLDRPIVR